MDFRVVEDVLEKAFSCFLVNFILLAHALFNFLVIIFKTWNMVHEIVLPEIPLAIESAVKRNGTKLIARCDPASKELERNRRVHRFCDAIKVLSTLRKADDHIVSSTFKNACEV